MVPSIELHGRPGAGEVDARRNPGDVAQFGTEVFDGAPALTDHSEVDGRRGGMHDGWARVFP